MKRKDKSRKERMKRMRRRRIRREGTIIFTYLINVKWTREGITKRK